MKRILTAIIAIILALGVKAQIEEPRSILEIGVGGGLNLSKMEFQPTIRQFYLNGAGGGVSIRYTSEKYPDVEVYLAEGGQDVYPFIFVAEG